MQIGVIGSYWSARPRINALKDAEKIGEFLAVRGIGIICGGDDKEGGTVFAAAKGAIRNGGNVIGLLVGTDKRKKMDYVTAPIMTGMSYGGREYILAVSSDAIIAIRGGAGTLNEITVAYQHYIPIIVLERSGGWAKKLADSYLDGRKRILIESAKTPEEAVELAIELARKNISKEG